MLCLFVFISGCVQESKIAKEVKGSGYASQAFARLNKTFNYRIGALGWHEKELYEQASLGIFWSRPHPGDAIWHLIERAKGRYDWSSLDRTVRNAQNLGINLIITIWPYAEWDQALCHPEMPETPDPFGGILPRRKGIPCDWEHYQRFLMALVERYDGDGKDDMPGLIYPVKYFEIGNEPEMTHGYDIFFQGTPEDYAILLKKSAEAIRKANNEAKILHAGIASSFEFSRDFWSKVFSHENIGKYFDIANIHDLQGAEDGNVRFVKALLKENGIDDKPVWVTEFSLYNTPEGEGKLDFEKVEERIKKAFEKGAEKIFLILPPVFAEMGKQDSERIRDLIDKYNKP
ncbi:MAG TPA: hypothetical protein ENG42_01430 [Candidatus Aenigmarchaeota archaeon]|nr:hypothetical protein [Candidatus Aenigmarchaeota archaeon]